MQSSSIGSNPPGTLQLQLVIRLYDVFTTNTDASAHDPPFLPPCPPPQSLCLSLTHSQPTREEAVSEFVSAASRTRCSATWVWK